MQNFIKGLFGNRSKQPEDTVSGYLGSIATWIENNAPAIKSNLNPAASEADITAVESALNIQMPVSIRDAYLTHNGEKSDSDGIFGLWRWLSLSDMAQEFHLLNEDKASEAARIPILLSPGGDILYAASGPESAIMGWWHENPSRDVKHSSFKAYLKWFSTRLHDGAYVFLPDELSGLVDQSDL